MGRIRKNAIDGWGGVVLRGCWTNCATSALVTHFNQGEHLIKAGRDAAGVVPFPLRDRRARLAGLEAAVLGVVCGVLNVILRLENCALLAGAAILFTALSAVMVATRPPDRSGQQTRTALKRYSRPSGSA